MEKVAVILPVYIKDNPVWLNTAVSSIVHQTYPDIKLFVGLDGPVTPEQELILKGFEGKFDINIVHYQENRGMAAVLNDLLALAFSEGYEFIARMDADDISLPERIEKQMLFLEQNPEIDVVGGANQRIDANDKLLDRFVYSPLTPEDCYKTFSRRTPLCHPSVLFRKRYFDKAGCMYRPEYRNSQDVMLWYDGLMKGVKMANIQDVILYFRVTDDLIAKRRNGWNRAKRQLVDRLKINRDLKYGFSANVYAFIIFLYMLSPKWLRSIAFKKMR